MRVLIVEDEAKLAALIRRGLQDEGMAADVAAGGRGRAVDGRRHRLRRDRARRDAPRASTASTVCRRLRADGVRSPVLMLTARDAVDDRVAGLDTGADDYLVKPFSFAELVARLRALARRGPVDRARCCAGRRPVARPVDPPVRRGRTEIALSAKEFALLETFMRHPGQVLDRLQLLEHVWDGEYENRSNVIDVYIRYLREKVDRPFGVASIETVRGAGYRLRADGGRA